LQIMADIDVASGRRPAIDLPRGRRWSHRNFRCEALLPSSSFSSARKLPLRKAKARSPD
jgi:hypothetical protein